MPQPVLEWHRVSISWTNCYNEVVDESLRPRPLYEQLFANLEEMGAHVFAERTMTAITSAYLEGFTFNIEPGQYRLIPMDFLPRIIDSKTFRVISEGLQQRARVLNSFLNDVYEGERTIVPDEVIYGSKYFYPDLVGVKPRNGVYIHVYGADLLFDGKEFFVIEDNLRVPSGVAYQLKMRELGRRFFPELRNGYRIAVYEPWKSLKQAMLDASWVRDPFMVLLSDGPYDSAYFEHVFLAEKLGIPLVEGNDLRIDDRGYVVAKIPGEGEVQVDVIYRRVEDLDIFVPGLSKAYIEGKVALVNAWGTGVADDKLVYHYLPQLIREYDGRDPILPQPPTYSPLDPRDLMIIERRLPELVVKIREGYGGLGTVILKDYRGNIKRKVAEQVLEDIRRNPEHYVLQETIDFSTTLLHSDTSPLLFRDAPVDLRVYVYYPANGPVVPPGGLSRYARYGRITNNTSGGGVKETWVVE